MAYSSLDIMSKKSITPEIELAIVAAYLQGKTAKAASALFGFSRGTADNVLKRHGVKHRRGQRAPKEHLDAMVNAYLEGKTIVEVGCLFNSCKASLSNELKRRGIPLRARTEHYKNRGFVSPKRAPQSALNEAVSFYMNGVTLKEAAKLYVVSSKAIVAELKRRGMESRPQVANECSIIYAKRRRAFSSLGAYRKWRKAVVDRDKSTCLDCGEYCKSLEVHHIYPLRTYPQLALEVSNGVSLCVECHYKLKNSEDEHTLRFSQLINSTVHPVVYYQHKY